MMKRMWEKIQLLKLLADKGVSLCVSYPDLTGESVTQSYHDTEAKKVTFGQRVAFDTQLCTMEGEKNNNVDRKPLLPQPMCV